MPPTRVTAGSGHGVIPAVVVVLVVVLTAAAAGIAGAQRQVRQRDLSVFSARVGTSAAYVAAAVDAQARRQSDTAAAFLAGAVVGGADVGRVAASLGAVAAVVEGPDGALVASFGADPGALVSAGASALRGAGGGVMEVSGGIALPGVPNADAMVAVPYRTGSGVRVLGAVYPSGGDLLAAFVAHVSVYAGHQTYLVDAGGSVIAADPPVPMRSGLPRLPVMLGTRLATLPAGESWTGTVGSGVSMATAAIPSTPWRLVVSAPDSALYASTSGIASAVPWLVWGAVLLLSAAMVVLASRFVRQHRELVEAAARLGEAARTDPLTGLPNRRSLLEIHERLVDVSARHGHTYAVLMADLDRFKEVNDTHGHEAGDRYLVAAAGCLRRALRDSDVAGRWGGDEFLALLPETGPDGAEEAARRVVAEGLATEVELDGADGHSVQLPVRFSAGWAEAAPGADPDAAVRAADASLYRAKAVGDGADQAGPPPTVPTGPGLPGPTRQ